MQATKKSGNNNKITKVKCAKEINTFYIAVLYRLFTKTAL